VLMLSREVGVEDVGLGSSEEEGCESGEARFWMVPHKLLLGLNELAT
jgi:hypothetical protein